MRPRITARWRAWASHHRVHVGIFFALAYVAVSQPAPGRFLVGALLVAAGEATRVWACGYLRKNRAVARDGPYRRIRHPLYLGSLLIGIGLGVLTQHAWLWLAGFAVMFAAFYLPAMYVEELRLQSLFGAEYQEYLEEVPRLVPRPWRVSGNPDDVGSESFSLEQALANHEGRTVAVMAALLVVQALKML